MYDREYGNKSYTLEPSGGLINSSLVMQDRETDSYWSIMRGKVLAGKLEGTKMVELPLGEKIKWKQWVKKHPETLVLSVDGREDAGPSYERYFSSAQGFRNQKANDTRLETKEPIFAFRYRETPYAIPLKSIEGGKVIAVGNAQIFFYRPVNAAIFYSTVAFISRDGAFKKQGKAWVHLPGNCRFNAEQKQFEGGEACPQRMAGFDTFWYNWSLNNPDTRLLTQTAKE